MKNIVFAAAVAIPLSGCLTAGDFFGTKDPCQQAEVAYTAFLAIAATNKNIGPQAKQAAKAGLAAARAQCSDGSVEKVTLNKLVRAYIEGLAAYKEQ